MLKISIKTYVARSIIYRKYLFGAIFLISLVMLCAQTKIPQNVSLHFKDAYLYYDVINDTLKIIAHDDTVSDGRNWNKYIADERAGIFHFREKNWKDFFWRVNTFNRKVYRVTKEDFSRYDEGFKGDDKELDIRIDIEGTSANPKRFFLRFSDAHLIYKPKNKSLKFMAHNSILSYGKFWKVKALKRSSPISTIKRETITDYHIRRDFWHKFYWQVDLGKRKVYRVKGGKFGKGGGDFEPLDITVEVVE